MCKPKGNREKHFALAAGAQIACAKLWRREGMGLAPCVTPRGRDERFTRDILQTGQSSGMFVPHASFVHSPKRIVGLRPGPGKLRPNIDFSDGLSYNERKMYMIIS